MEFDVTGCDLILHIEIVGINVFRSGIADVIFSESNDGLVVCEQGDGCEVMLKISS